VEKAKDLNDSGQKFMIRQIEKGDTKGGVIIPKDKYKGVCGILKEVGGRKMDEMGSSSKGGIYEVSFGYNSKMEVYATLMSDITC
jgi:hypothetical protein